MEQPEGVQIATLRRLWQAAHSLGRIRAARASERGERARDRTRTGAQGDRLPGGGTDAADADRDAPLWGAYTLRLLDVRSDPEFRTRHLPEAGGLPAGALAQRRSELPPKGRDL
ncbi:MAG: hypothetical protein GF330_13775, partial [Candidatus Eisenbacteria bacterium]|nr:hypothetical protein [Candidatus Eisenbacteria bacterium]